MHTKYTLIYLLALLIGCMPLSLQSQCSFGNDKGSFDPQNNFDWAQSFTVECDGFLEYVEFITGSGGTQQARTLEIFEGETVSGTPIYTQEFPEMNFGGARESLRINITDNFPVEEGEQFTFLIPGVTVNLLVDVNDPYPGGFAFENGGVLGEIVDFVFNVSVSDQALTVDDLNIMFAQAYPNPSSGIMDVTLGRVYQDITVVTYNFIGQVVMQEEIPSADTLRMDISSLAEGTYYSVIMTTTNRGSFRFIKS